MYLRNSIAGITTCIGLVFSTTIPLTLSARHADINTKSAENDKILFLENKGQIIDQQLKHRNDIDFRLSGSNVNVFVGDGKIHYQWTKTESNATDGKNTSIYRLDATLVGANINAKVIRDEQASYYENYYLPQCPDGATAHAYRSVTYQNIYPNIDWTLYVQDNQLKYDFIVHSGGNPADIKIKYEGASGIKLEDGAITVQTPFGLVSEQKPYSYNANTKQEVASAFVLNGNTLSFNIAASEGDIVIDPVIGWGTYYGLNSGSSTGAAVAGDASGNGYLIGNTSNNNNIASTGAHQTTFAGVTDAYIIKFNVSGGRAWATYYGGADQETVRDGVCDYSGNIIVVGQTLTSTGSGIASSGSHQQANAGNGFGGTNARDGFIGKFNSAGIRQWGTYYGGTQIEDLTGVSCDKANNIYVVGNTTSTNGTSVATSSAYQTTPASGFLVKFSASGSRQWGTYYGTGVTGTLIMQTVAADTAGNVYVGGTTGSQSSLTTSGALQTSFGGGTTDGFIAKFSTGGSRQWGTYFGGSGDDMIQKLFCDRYNNLFVGGNTTSTSGIATSGTHQTSLSGGTDGFLERLNATSSQRIWGTYIGGTAAENVWGIYAGHERVIYISGTTMSSSGIATAGNYQTSFAGTTPGGFEGDGYFCKFDFDGKRLWGTYYGGDSEESNVKIAFGGGKLFVGGSTGSDAGIATSNGYQQAPTNPPPPPPAFPNAGFLAQFEADTALYFDEIFRDTLTCLADTLYIKYGVTNNYRPGNDFILQLSDVNGSFANPTRINLVTAQGGGNFKYWIPDTLTPGAGYRIRIISTQFPDTSWDNGKDIRVSEYPQPKAVAIFPICANSSLTLDDQGVSPSSTNYTWTGPGGFSISQKQYIRPNVQITDSGWYVLTADNYGCVASDSVHVLIFNKPVKPTVSTNSPVCEGDTLKVWATTPTTSVTSWNWLKPAGFVQETGPDTTIISAALTDTGWYRALAVAGGCPSDLDSVHVTVEPKAAPTVQIAVDKPNSGPFVTVKFSVTGFSNQGPNPTYQWKKNGVDIPNATQDTYTTITGSDLQDGDTICVLMTSSLTCPTPKTAKSCIEVTIDLGVKELNPVGNVGLYPNPNNGLFTLMGKTATDKKISLQVLNVMGQVVFEDVVMPVNKQLNKQINLTNVPNGVYMVQLKTDDGVSTVKFSIDR